MDWSNYSIPAMQLEARFGDRVVPAFSVRPKSISTMIADAVSKNPDGEALVCGAERLTWREVEQRSAGLAAGVRGGGVGGGGRGALLLRHRGGFGVGGFWGGPLGGGFVVVRPPADKTENGLLLGGAGGQA